jgi:hypothetical protein
VDGGVQNIRKIIAMLVSVTMSIDSMHGCNSL